MRRELILTALVAVLLGQLVEHVVTRVARAAGAVSYYCAKAYTKADAKGSFVLSDGQAHDSCLNPPGGTPLGTTTAAKAPSDLCEYCGVVDDAAARGVAATIAANPALRGCGYNEDDGGIYLVGMRSHTTVRWDVATGTLTQVSAVPIYWTTPESAIGAPVAATAAITNVGSIASVPTKSTLSTTGSATAAIAGGATGYLSLDGTVQVADVPLEVANQAATLTQICCFAGAAPGLGQSVAFTARQFSSGSKTWADTAVACTLAGSATQCCSPTGAVALAAQDMIGAKAVQSLASVAAKVTCTLTRTIP